MIEFLNSKNLHKISIDMPSGIFADKNFDEKATIFKADDTLSFQFYKKSFLHPETGKFCGRIHILDIGLNEKYIEKKFVEAVKKAGGLAPKFVSPGLNGVPDRIVLLPGGHIAFVELKAPGKMMRSLQLTRKRQLESLGYKVFCIDELSQIGGVIDEIQRT